MFKNIHCNCIQTNCFYLVKLAIVFSKNEVLSKSCLNRFGVLKKTSGVYPLLSAAKRRGTPVLLSASVSDNFGNFPQMAAPRRSCEIDQSTQHFHVGWFHVG